MQLIKEAEDNKQKKYLATLVYEAIQDEMKEIDKTGLIYIPDPNEMAVPFVVTQALIETYHGNSRLEEMLQKMIYLHPCFNMMTPGQEVSANHYLMTALRIFPEDFIKPVMQDKLPDPAKVQAAYDTFIAKLQLAVKSDAEPER